jgi:hypothetical protein
MYSFASADESPVAPLLLSGVTETGKPFKRRRQLPTIGQDNMEQASIRRHINCGGVKFSG